MAARSRAPNLFSVPLEDSRTSLIYRTRLTRCIGLFCSWILSSFDDYSPTWLQDVSRVNQLLCSFIQHLYDSNQPLYVARHTVAGVQDRLPQLRGKLHRAWNAVKAWHMSLTVQSRVPFTSQILDTLFLKAVDLGLGKTGGAAHWFSLAVLIKVGFFGVLRAGEVFQLRVGHVHFIKHVSLSPVAILAIVSPKTKAVFGRSQFVIVKDEATVCWLEWLCAGLPKQTKLWPSDGPKFRKMLKTLTRSLGLDHLHFSPGSLRASGATHYLVSGLSVAHIQHMGRWASERSLHVYLQEATASLVLNQVSPELLHIFSDVLFAQAHTLAKPPNQHWSRFFSRRKQWPLVPLRHKNSFNMRSHF